MSRYDLDFWPLDLELLQHFGCYAFKLCTKNWAKSNNPWLSYWRFSTFFPAILRGWGTTGRQFSGVRGPNFSKLGQISHFLTPLPVKIRGGVGEISITIVRRNVRIHSMAINRVVVERGGLIKKKKRKKEDKTRHLSVVCMYVCMYIRSKQLTNRSIDNTDNKRKSKR